MKKIGLVAAVLTSLFILIGTATVAAQSSTRPPTQLKKVGDHWTAWDPPAPGPDAYIIVRGDTLWDLAGRWFGDPFLWPQIWDENRYILDSHWIYPGDPLVVPGRPTVVPEVPPVAQAVPEDRRPPERPTLPQPPPLMPAADPADLYCSGTIERDHAASGLEIAGRDLERVSLGEGDVVFLNRGKDGGLRAGDEFAVLRPADSVTHPETRQPLGKMVRRMGRLRVMIAHEATSTAVITMSCEDIYEGDELVPWEEIPVPMLTELPPFDRYDPRPSGGRTGHIVAARDNLEALAAGHVIFTDLGRQSEVAPGDLITLFRDRRHDLPRLVLGRAVILTVGSDTSTAKIVTSTRESLIGDRVEVLR